MNCETCAQKHMTVQSNCTRCEDGYVLLINECISKQFSAFTIYFGLIFSHLCIVGVLVLLFVQHRKKEKRVEGLPEDSK